MRSRAVLVPVLLAALGLAAGAEPRIEPVAPVRPNRLYVLLTPYETAGPSAIATFHVDADGEPRLLTTQETGGRGRALTSQQPLVIHRSRNLLLSANNESGEVSVFRIAGDGSLTPAAGSPFPVGLVPNAMTLDPFRDELYVTTLGAVGVYEVASDGQLRQRQVLAGGFPRGTAPHRRGRYLYVADFRMGMRGYAISGSGTWTELPGSPFQHPMSRPFCLALDSLGDRLFLQDLDLGVLVFDIEPTGGLVLVEGSPFSVGGFSSEFELTADDRFLYVSRPYAQEMIGFETTPRGPLVELPGSPFPADFVAASLRNPYGTTRLYEITRETRRIHVSEIDPAGRLVPTPFSPVDVLDEAGRVPAGAAFDSVPLNVLRP